MKLPHFDNWSNGELSKIGHHFGKRCDFKNNVNYKKCDPKFIFFDEK